VAGVHPRILAATRSQLDVWRTALRAGAGRVGWKIGLGIEEVEELIGTEPVIGHLTTLTLLDSGGTYAAQGARDLRAETELAIEVGREGTVAGLAVALEIVDVARPPAGVEGIVAANNVFHRAVGFGPTQPGTSLAGARARLLVGGELRDEGAVRGDPAATVRAVARLLHATGERLEPRDRILAGSSCHVPAGPGDAVAAEIDGLGRVEARITA
jgi:2-keto-4-pentenoate hydratase